MPPRPLPKVKSSPVTTPAAPSRLDQTIGDEIGRGDRGELGVEMEDEHRVGAGRLEQPLALVQRGQPEGRQVRA